MNRIVALLICVCMFSVGCAMDTYHRSDHYVKGDVPAYTEGGGPVSKERTPTRIRIDGPNAIFGLKVWIDQFQIVRPGAKDIEVNPPPHEFKVDPGYHKVRLYSPDFKRSKEFSVRIKEGETVTLYF